jgi:hypothetical protein
MERLRKWYTITAINQSKLNNSTITNIRQGVEEEEGRRERLHFK